MAKGTIKNLGYTRDPSGLVFLREGMLYRQINSVYKENYDFLMNSGLYKALVDNAMLIPHEEVDIKLADSDKAYKVINPETVPFISYPYEWCFSQLKEAALITLKIQKIALEFGMSLKDSSAYNIQFKNGKLVLIDTLSFEKYHTGQPWIAYRQFCQHFLGPLALMSYKDARLNQLFMVFIDGIPIDLSSSILPFRSYLRFPLLSHLHLHARTQKYCAKRNVKASYYKMSKLSLAALIDNLEATVSSLRLNLKGSRWTSYYTDTDYSANAFEHKKQIVTRFLETIRPKSVWDFGANTGLFSRIASTRGIETLSFDIDPYVIEKSYLECIKNGEINLLPLVMDVTNPSPSIGWDNEERMSLLERGPAEAVFALALIHHLAFSNNLPLSNIASFFGKICNYLIIEFVPKNDSQVQQMLSGREDIFSEYGQQNFETEFKRYFTIQGYVQLKDSKRILYLMQKMP